MDGSWTLKDSKQILHESSEESSSKSEEEDGAEMYEKDGGGGGVEDEEEKELKFAMVGLGVKWCEEERNPRMK